jgi:hypothetical protein
MDGGSIPPSSTKSDPLLTAVTSDGMRKVICTFRFASIVVEATAASTKYRFVGSIPPTPEDSLHDISHVGRVRNRFQSSRSRVALWVRLDSLLLSWAR